MKTEDLIIKLYGTQPESIEERRFIEEHIKVLEMGQSIEKEMEDYDSMKFQDFYFEVRHQHGLNLAHRFVREFTKVVGEQPHFKSYPRSEMDDVLNFIDN